MRPKPAPEPDTESRRKHCSDDARILVVDDLNTNREIIEAYLEDNGYRVDTGAAARSDPDARQRPLRSRPDGYPDAEYGWRRRDPAHSRAADPDQDVPIIAMTGNVLPHQVKSFLDAGMNDHVGKPIERAKLYDNVRRWLPSGDNDNAPH